MSMKLKGRDSPFFSLVDTVCGPMVVVWRLSGTTIVLIHLFLPEDGVVAIRSVLRTFPQALFSSSPVIHPLLKEIVDYCEGKSIDFSVKLDTSSQSFFQKRVLNATRKIPRGKITSYAAIAMELGGKHLSRGVGASLGANPFPLIIPCHRVVGSDGSLTGFGGGISLKRFLLQKEGITFDSKGRVLSEYFLCGMNRKKSSKKSLRER
jgi:methylated-DNA-[protein]-cysteine S-methyltransferase